MSTSERLSNREKLQALRRVAAYRPGFSFGLVVLGAIVAVFEGIGLGFIYPIIETAQSEDPTAVSGPVMETFVGAYELVGLPFTLGYLILGVAGVMTVRYTMSFVVSWLSIILAKRYEKHLRTRAFDGALDAEVGYYDQEGTDDILNAVINETRYSDRVNFVVNCGRLRGFKPDLSGLKRDIRENVRKRGGSSFYFQKTRSITFRFS